MIRAFALCLGLLGVAEVSAQGIPSGSETIKVTIGPHGAQIEIEVFTYKPAGYRDGPLIIVCHGIMRNAKDYRDHAQAMGDRFGALIAAPKFDDERFSFEKYQLGGVVKFEGNPFEIPAKPNYVVQGGVIKPGKPVPQAEWTFPLVPEIAAEIRRREKRPDLPYYLIGHSAGGQFLARLSAFVDPQAVRIIAANPGTHLRPTREEPFPYGLGGLAEELSNDRAIRCYLAQPLTFFLGTEDRDADDQYLDQRPEAKAQGAYRLERGRNTFEFGRKLAADRGWSFQWRLVEASGVDHDHEKMFNHAQCASALFGVSPSHVVGHRGLLKSAPENTLANFRACLALRLGFEFDVRRTSDGYLVCLHDDTVDRTTDGLGRVAEMTLAQVRRLDAGRWFSAEFARERVPTIDEVFALIAAHKESSPLAAVDIKASDEKIEADLVQLANKHQVLSRLVFIGRTIESEVVRRWLKQADAKAQVARLIANAAELDSVADSQDDWLYVRFIPSGAAVRRLHAAGQRVFLAGPLVAGEEPANWKSAAVNGVDAILTDHPLELRQQLARPK